MPCPTYGRRDKQTSPTTGAKQCKVVLSVLAASTSLSLAYTLMSDATSEKYNYSWTDPDNYEDLQTNP